MKWTQGLRRRIEKYISIGALISISAITGCVLYWQNFETKPPVTFYSLPHHQYVIDKSNTITIDRVICSTKDIDIIAKRTIRDGINYALDDYHGFVKKGCVKRTTTLRIPELPTGYYVFDSTVIVKVNPLHTVEISLQPIQFVITDSNGKVPEFKQSRVDEPVRQSFSTEFKDQPLTKEEVTKLITKGQLK